MVWTSLGSTSPSDINEHFLHPQDGSLEAQPFLWPPDVGSSWWLRWCCSCFVIDLRPWLLLLAGVCCWLMVAGEAWFDNWEFLGCPMWWSTPPLSSPRQSDSGDSLWTIHNFFIVFMIPFIYIVDCSIFKPLSLIINPTVLSFSFSISPFLSTYIWHLSKYWILYLASKPRKF